MTSRTIKFYGQGFGPTTASVTVMLDGATVYTGEIPTIDENPAQYVAEQTGSTDCYVELFSINVPVETNGLKPMSVTVDTEDNAVALAQILANYVQIKNPVFNDEEWTQIDSPTATLLELLPIFSAHASPAFTTEQTAVLEDTSTDPSVVAAQDLILKTHGVAPYVSSGASGYGYLDDGESRENIKIDDVAIDIPSPRPSEFNGTWTVVLTNGSVLTYDLMFTSGIQ